MKIKMRKRLEEAGSEKMRMREYFRRRGISIADAERRCGFARGFLSTGGVVGSDKLAKMIEAFPDADLYYLVTGKTRSLSAPPDDGDIAKTLNALEAAEQKRRALIQELARILSGM